LRQKSPSPTIAQREDQEKYCEIHCISSLHQLSQIGLAQSPLLKPRLQLLFTGFRQNATINR
jgi:hypothetical protein